jgi:anti-sigma regulatory factor (Ser/Thr protein kinase)
VTVATEPVASPGGAFHHEALIYRTEAELVAGATAFIRDGLAAGEAVLVALMAPKIRLLREALGADADRVRFADMLELGRNPARIMPVWQQFVDQHVGPQRPARGIGEPIWAGRRPPEVAEAQLHEALLNVAFDDGPGWRLLCPYDAAQLGESMLAAARRTHRHLTRSDGRREDGDYPGADYAVAAFGAALDEPVGVAVELDVDAGGLAGISDIVARHAGEAGVTVGRLTDLALAAQEVVANSVRYGGGGRLRMWSDVDALVVEVSDRGQVRNPLAGRIRPDLGAGDGRGLWLVNQLCDLVQLRSGPGGTTVRLITWLA